MNLGKKQIAIILAIALISSVVFTLMKMPKPAQEDKPVVVAVLDSGAEENNADRLLELINNDLAINYFYFGEQPALTENTKLYEGFMYGELAYPKFNSLEEIYAVAMDTYVFSQDIIFYQAYPANTVQMFKEFDGSMFVNLDQFKTINSDYTQESVAIEQVTVAPDNSSATVQLASGKSLGYNFEKVGTSWKVVSSSWRQYADDAHGILNPVNIV